MRGCRICCVLLLYFLYTFVWMVDVSHLISIPSVMAVIHVSITMCYTLELWTTYNQSFYKSRIIYIKIVSRDTEHDNTRYEGTKIPLNHGLSRVAMINTPFININTSNNRIPSARIHDLRSMGMEKDSIVTLVFTATGDDLDHGIGMSGMEYV